MKDNPKEASNNPSLESEVLFVAHQRRKIKEIYCMGWYLSKYENVSLKQYEIFAMKNYLGDQTQ